MKFYSIIVTIAAYDLALSRQILSVFYSLYSQKEAACGEAMWSDLIESNYKNGFVCTANINPETANEFDFLQMVSNKLISNKNFKGFNC
jgi:hypothetical protein